MGVASGESMAVQLPDGNTFEVVVPDGVDCGSIIVVELPDAQEDTADRERVEVVVPLDWAPRSISNCPLFSPECQRAGCFPRPERSCRIASKLIPTQASKDPPPARDSAAKMCVFIVVFRV